MRYVLQGSVRRFGDRVRVNTQLIDAESDLHIWADRFDMPLADIFEMQDEIVTRLARALDVHLVAAEARRSQGAVAAAPHSDRNTVFSARFALIGALLSTAATPALAQGLVPGSTNTPQQEQTTSNAPATPSPLAAARRGLVWRPG